MDPSNQRGRCIAGPASSASRGGVGGALLARQEARRRQYGDLGQPCRLEFTTTSGLGCAGSTVCNIKKKYDTEHETGFRASRASAC
eukprot:327635-Pyramimonas_sp.AAC.2